MKKYLMLFAVLTLYLVSNFWFSPGWPEFFGHIIAHGFLLGITVWVGFVLLITLPDETELLLDVSKDLWETILLTTDTVRLDQELNKIIQAEQTNRPLEH